MIAASVLDDFKGFVKRGNVIDMAVGVVIGVAFGAITNSLVEDILTPVLSLLTGDVDFGNLYILLREGDPGAPYRTLADAQSSGAVTLNYGNTLNAVLNFLLVAAAMFLLVRFVQHLNDEGEPENTPSDPNPRRCPHCRTEIADAATRCPACTSELGADS